MINIYKKIFNIDRIIRKRIKRKDFFFIQIGSNDGVTKDPIHKYIIKYNWKGILIEPVKYIFENLVKNYKNQKNLYFENIAISNKNEIKNFYRLKKTNEKEIPFWYDQIGSFHLGIILKHEKNIPNIQKRIIKEAIECKTFNELIKKYNISEINLLHIDTEGPDFEILKTINFDKIKPEMIYFEYKHLNKEDRKNSLRLLKNHGYFILGVCL